MTFKSIITGILFIAFSFTMQAQSTAKSVKKTQVNQHQRIKQGVRSGELTRKETAKLTRQQANIQQTKKRAKADGVVTRKERAIIRKKQANASKNIAIKKHNGKDRN